MTHLRNDPNNICDCDSVFLARLMLWQQKLLLFSLCIDSSSGRLPDPFSSMISIQFYRHWASTVLKYSAYSGNTDIKHSWFHCPAICLMVSCFLLLCSTPSLLLPLVLSGSTFLPSPTTEVTAKFVSDLSRGSKTPLALIDFWIYSDHSISRYTAVS